MVSENTSGLMCHMKAFLFIFANMFWFVPLMLVLDKTATSPPPIEVVLMLTVSLSLPLGELLRGKVKKLRSLKSCS